MRNLNSISKYLFALLGIIFYSSVYAQTDNYSAPASASTGSASSNTVVGSNAGNANSTKGSNSFYGVNTGLNNSKGFSNCYFGVSSGRFNTTGNSNSFYGFNAGIYNTTGSSNSSLGLFAGGNNRTGSFNCFIGGSSGNNIESGSYNVTIGYRAGPTSANEGQSNRLYIDVNENTVNGALGNDNPLIYGEFDNDFVKINGTFEVTAGLSNPSDVNLKNNFQSIDQQEILQKLSDLTIQKWTYKDRTDEPHIGLIAQDFHKAFGLGADDKHISTIDADGVALAAIQALKKQNDEQQKIIDDLLQRIIDIENRN